MGHNPPPLLVRVGGRNNQDRRRQQRRCLADVFDGLGDRFEGADPGDFLAVPRCKNTTGPACPLASKISSRKSTAATPPAWRSPPARTTLWPLKPRLERVPREG